LDNHLYRDQSLSCLLYDIEFTWVCILSIPSLLMKLKLDPQLWSLLWTLTSICLTCLCVMLAGSGNLPGLAAVPSFVFTLFQEYEFSGSRSLLFARCSSSCAVELHAKTFGRRWNSGDLDSNLRFRCLFTAYWMSLIRRVEFGEDKVHLCIFIECTELNSLYAGSDWINLCGDSRLMTFHEITKPMWACLLEETFSLCGCSDPAKLEYQSSGYATDINSTHVTRELRCS
jgi:hypothetical protein